MEQTRTPHPANDTRSPGGLPDRPALPPVGRPRRALAGFAALATLPYLALKVAWLSGSRTGLNDPEFGRSTAMQILNSLTLALDVVALVLAVVFLTRRGLRAPAWLVLPPMWIGAGLLGQILVSLPLALVVQAVAPSQPPTEELPPLDAWVYPVVYAGFAGLGIGLLGAFAIYAHQRWGGQQLPALTPFARRVLVGVATLIVVSMVGHMTLRTLPLGTRLLDLAVACTAAAALLALQHPDLRGRAARAVVVVAFIGTGALAAWGTYLFVITVIPNELVGQTAIDWQVAGVSAGRALAGMAGAGALAARLSRRPARLSRR
ncbi:hypothetical protein [Ornithinimicrobium murale]|uniref:hypothetical protein n=1 Tax=Ornithinimicrobium murale TaxID=1050153 RepID=UPI0013B4335A|nr:hypothetical protein [Ornithinimicrobium murale]